MITEEFSRQVVTALIELKLGRMSYFNETGLVVPEKLGNLKHSVALTYGNEFLILNF